MRLPSALAVAPSGRNIAVKPATKATECSSVAVRSRARAPRSSWLPSQTAGPTSRATYTGVSGSTHGERNESSPARKAPKRVMLPVVTACSVTSPRHQAQGTSLPAPLLPGEGECVRFGSPSPFGGGAGGGDCPLCLTYGDRQDFGRAAQQHWRDQPRRDLMERQPIEHGGGQAHERPLWVLQKLG